jgi:hypothetical protein
MARDSHPNWAHSVLDGRVTGRFRPPYAGDPDLITSVVSDVVTDVLIDVFSGVGGASGDFDGCRAAPALVDER